MSRRSGPHVEDVRRLLAFHGIDYGTPDGLASMEAKLADSSAFRADLSALARHISDLEHRTVTDDEMQSLIELAAGGKQPVEQSVDSRVPAQDATATDPDSTRSTAATIPADTRAAAAAPETDGSQHRLELAITELKVYLDDIDRRIGRLEPRLEDITRIIQSSADRPQQSQDAAGPEPPSAGQPHPSTDPQTRRAALHLPEEADLRHRGAPLPAPLARPSAEDPPPVAANSPVPDPAPAAEPIRPVGTAQLRPWEHMTAPIEHKRSSSSTRQTVGRILGVAAVLLAIVGGIAALYAFGNPGESASTAQTGTQSNQGGGPTSDQGRSAPQPSAMSAQQTGGAPAPPSTSPENRLEPISQPEPTAQPKTPVSVPILRPKQQNRSTAPAKVAGKRAEPLRHEPNIEVMPAVQPPPHGTTAVERPAAQHIASRTGNEGVGTLAANSPPPDVTSHGAGTPEVESHSSEGALVSSRKPVYPPEAISQHKEGTVVLDALIAKDGTVKRMDVVEGAPGFTRSALNAVSWWRYKPNRARGEAETQARITVNYRIR